MAKRVLAKVKTRRLVGEEDAYVVEVTAKCGKIVLRCHDEAAADLLLKTLNEETVNVAV